MPEPVDSPRVIAINWRGFTFAWRGGEYAEIAEIAKNELPFEVLNMSNQEGVLPPFTWDILVEKLDSLTSDYFADMRRAHKIFKES